MYGLAVRWSLVDVPSTTGDALRDYVAEKSYDTFAQLPGLHMKTWRARDGEWFEGIYVFASTEARADFQADFAPRADQTPVSQLTGAGPISIEPFEVISVVEGPENFRSVPRFER